jgi:ABC-type nitrate/sulfonate/bicarbonate transport system ATPase subunit
MASRSRAAEDFGHGVSGAVAVAVAHHGGQRAVAAGNCGALSQQLQRPRRKEYEERARKLLQKVGLGGYEDKFPWQLSGGMQQRASICRALIHEPKMLLLDEPFGALDAFTREELWCILRDLWTEQQFNVILVTHDLRESVFLADTVYVMSKSPGRFVVKREIDLPRPRDLEITYTTAEFYRHRARTARPHRRHPPSKPSKGPPSCTKSPETDGTLGTARWC